MNLFEAYRTVHEQGFVPIFVQDELDSQMLIEACLEAGVRAVEYTLRRTDAREMIPWIKQHYPDICLLAGSTVDDENIVRHCRKRYPQLMTVSELDQAGVDGFVSMLPWKEESIRACCRRRLVMPCAATSGEAFLQVAAGAHFAKLIGPGLEVVQRCRAVPTFDFCPVFITGGMTTQRIPEAVEAGAAVIGSGFDLILAGEVSPNSKTVVRKLREFIDAAADARAKKWPDMARAIGGDRQTWLDSLPHYHPF